MREIPFSMNGPLALLTDAALPFSRPMGGWLATAGKLDGDGITVPTTDRDGQVFEAVAELGRVDWTPYVQRGVWNDTHNEAVTVGLPDSLAYYDAASEMAAAHGKIGLYTTGHLFDRDDPRSWAGLTDADGVPREPTPREFERADHFWALAGRLAGLPRTLALSAHGRMALSPCGKRIILALIEAAAVCELPKNPDATLEPLRLGVPGAKIRVTASACGRCRCPAGVCAARTDAPGSWLLRKADALVAAGGPGIVTSSAGGIAGINTGRSDGTRAIVREDLEPAAFPLAPGAGDTGDQERLLRQIQRMYLLDEPAARRWVDIWRSNRTSEGPHA